VKQLLLFFLREAKLAQLLSHHTFTFSIHALTMNTIFRSLCPLRYNPASIFHTSQKQTQQLKQKKKKEKKQETFTALAPPTRIPPSTGTSLYFPYFLHYIREHAGKRSLHRLLIA